MINKRQYKILSFFLTRSLFLGGCFSLLVNLTKNSMIISGIIGILVGYFILYLLYKCNGSLCKLIKIVSILFILLISLLSSMMLTSNYLLIKTPSMYLLLFFFIMLFYSKSKKIDVVARISEILIVVSICCYILGYIGIIPNIKISMMYPIIDSNVFDVIKGVIIFCGASLLPNLLLLEYKEDFKFKDISIGYILGSISIISIIFLILTIYGSELSSIARFPEYLILKKVNIMSYITNLENILVMEWIINIIICCLFSVRVLYEELNKIVFYIVLLLLFGLLEFILFKNYVFILMIKNYVYYGCFILVIFGLLFRKKKTTD